MVLVNTNRLTPAATASSSRFSVPAMFVSTNCARSWEATWGLWSVAEWTTASTPATALRTHARSAIDPTTVGGRRLEHVEADHLVAVVAQHARERLAEMPGAAGDQNPHPVTDIRTP